VLDASLAFKSVNADAVYFVLRRRLPACRKPDDVMMFLVRQLSEARTRVMDFLQDDEEYITLQFDVAPYCPLCFDPHAFFWGEKTPFSKAIDDAHRRALRLLQEENDEAEAEEAMAETEAEKAEEEESEEDFEDEEEDEENFESEEDEESEEEEDEDDEAKAEKAETETDDDEEADR
jgi:TATA-binding protein-associated factor Taf7